MMEYQQVFDQVREIVLPLVFADDDMARPIGEIVKLSSLDRYYILRELRRRFHYTRKCNIPTVSINELAKKVYDFLKENENRIWNHHEICAYISLIFSGVVGRRLDSSEKIGNFKKEADTKNKVHEFYEALNEIYEFAGVKIDNPESAIYNIAIRATYNLAKKGKAVTPRQAISDMEFSWGPLWIVMSFGCLTAILKQEFDIDASHKKMTQKLVAAKSFQEFENCVINMIIDDRIHKIFRKHDTSLTAKEKSIKKDIEQVLHITIDYDILGVGAGELCNHVYDIVEKSKDLRNELIGRTETPKADELLAQLNSKALSCDEVFRIVCNDIIKAIGRNIERKEKIYNILQEMRDKDQNPNDLENALHGLENNFGINIDTTNLNLSINDVCNMAQQSFVKKGKSTFMHLDLGDMERLWGMICRSIPSFSHLGRVLGGELDSPVSEHVLANITDYYVYQQAIILKNRYGAKVSDYLSQNPTYGEYKKFIASLPKSK